MGIAALILGIISFMGSMIPFIFFLAFVPALVGLILGICELTSKRDKAKKKKTESIVGIVLSSIAILVIVIKIFFVVLFGSLGFIDAIVENMDEYIDEYDDFEEYKDDYNKNIKDFEKHLETFENKLNNEL